MRSKTRHGVHSPFVYRFLDQCLYREADKILFEIPEEQRRKLKNDQTALEYTDPGAGSKKQKQKTSQGDIRTRVRDIARNSLQNPRYCRFFYRMMDYFGCRNVLEMGTSFGITTSYMGLAGDHIKIDTIEGAQPVADIAENFFSDQGFTNINLYRGNFDQILKKAVSGKKYDLIFMDGNHNGEKTLDYFQKLTKHITEQGVIIVDDIRWSESMYEAWKSIKLHQNVTLSIDLFRMGMVFFDKRLTKEEFAIRF
ncbi:MAG: class I SAM-dependent methyltransferase [Bacteroidales bacterium]|nr:class I SAM-dependent methyltransferase [Bacteroidales bacterium]